ncbi:hypothetical protein TL16_g05243 [Triparma laevis f. inornata]|uniref:EF-hand domain-containing protein n=1 Tax=Triparma laevis f. inornata TaxID=1714386 RepID=A0A9W7AD34_9STRA|nr:hypothetical protein TL16_g05243 [Triparma laevis f. inornata]
MRDPSKATAKAKRALKDIQKPKSAKAKIKAAKQDYVSPYSVQSTSSKKLSVNGDSPNKTKFAPDFKLNRNDSEADLNPNAPKAPNKRLRSTKRPSTFFANPNTVNQRILTLEQAKKDEMKEREARRREKNEDDGAIEEEGDKTPEEEEECPFVTDKYIMPEQWTGFARTWITKVSLPARILALSEAFGSFILGVIIVAGVLVGVQTYPGMETNQPILIMDQIILFIFCVEILTKMLAEGMAPWRYFVSREWKWNNFDFAIVMACMPLVDLGNSISLLRLFRLMRLAKLVKKIPQLQVIIMGLVGGFTSIGYILLLLFLVMYLFAIAGIYAFRENDPFHYGDLFTALLTLFRASTLEDWTDLMYINMFGCDTYANVYVGDEARTPDNTAYWCTFAMEKYWMSQIYFVGFIFISALAMLSLFVGAVTMAMSEALEQMAEEKELKMKAKKAAEKLKRLEDEAHTRARTASTGKGLRGNSSITDEEKKARVPSKRLSQSLHDLIGVGSIEEDDKKVKKLTRDQKLMLGAWEDCDMMQMKAETRRKFSNPIRQLWHDISLVAKKTVENTHFVNFITLVIICAGGLVGIQTYPGWGEDEVTLQCETDQCKMCGQIDFVILIIFTVEIGLKFVAADCRPYRVLKDAWNAFDLLIVIGSYVLGGGMITMLRLLRLLRVLKLVKAFPQLQVIVSALIMGMASIGYIGVILVMVFYVFGIIGMILFAANDPWHFGTLHIAMLSLFRASTFEDWTDIMYINMYGCDQYGYSAWPQYCTDPHASGAIAAIFFVIFVIIGGLVLLTLFVGVVSTSMDEAQKEQQAELFIEARVKYLQDEANIDPREMDDMKDVFAILDLSNDGNLDITELVNAFEWLEVVKTKDEAEEMFKMFKNSGDTADINIADFVKFMYNLKVTKAAGSDRDYELGKKEWQKYMAER